MASEYYKGDSDHYLNERVKICFDLITEFSSHIGKIENGVRMADLGCGDGRALKRLNRLLESRAITVSKIFAVDLNPSVREEGNVEVITSDLNMPGLSLPDRCVEVAYALETIEHLVNVDIFVHEANRILEKNGIFIVTTPNLLAWFNRFLMTLGSLPIHYEIAETKSYGKRYGRLVAKRGVIAGHVRVFSPRALCELLEDNGFEVLKIKGLNFLDGFTGLEFKILNALDLFFSNFPSLSSTFAVICRKVS